MSQSSIHSRNLITEKESEYQAETEFYQWNEHADLKPAQLSGDENGEQSVLVSVADSSKANTTLTITVIVKTIIGAGILTIPYTAYRMGYVLSIILFVGAAVMNQFATLLLLKAKNLSHHSNYATIFYQIWRSKVAKSLGSVFIFLTGLGVCMAELIIFKTSIRKILEDIIEDQDVLDRFYTHPITIVIIVAVLLLPLTLASKIQNLRFMGLLGVFGILFFMGTFILYYILCLFDSDIGAEPKGQMRMFPEDWFRAAASVPNVLLSITFQNNFFPIYKGMKDVSDKKFLKAGFAGVFSSAITYLIIGILGYSYVGEGVDANFLQSFEYNQISKPFYFLLNGFFLVSIFFAFPIMFFGCRNNFIALVKLAFEKQRQKGKKWRSQDQEEEISTYIRDQEYARRKKKARLHFVLYTLILYLAMVGVAVGMDDIQIVFNAVGAICISALAPLLPCYFYFMLVIKKKQQKGPKFFAAVIIFSIMLPYSLFAVISLYI